MAEERFPMKLDAWARPLLLVGGARPDNSYMKVTDEGIVVRFGLLFNRVIPRSQIASAALGEWPLWLGVGWRAGFGGRYGLIGSYSGIVELQLNEPIDVLRFFNFTSISISLEEPQRFLDALGADAPAPDSAEPADEPEAASAAAEEAPADDSSGPTPEDEPKSL